LSRPTAKTAALALCLALGGGLAGYLASASAARAGAARARQSLPVASLAAAGRDGARATLPVLAEVPVRNVVLLVGDGLGLAQFAAARIAAYGPEGRLELERFPTVGLVTTHAAGALITKSDAAATALATGHKTRLGRVGSDALGRPIRTLLETLRDAGWATGLATTSRITDATPAAFAAHVAERRDEAGIAADLSDARVDLLAGGGRKFFLPKSAPEGARADGRDLTAEMHARGVEVVADAAGLAAAKRLPVAALFGVEPQKSDPRSPTLGAIAEKSLGLLAASGRPFFLLLEEEEIDSAAHARDAARMMAAVLRFDAAVSAAVDFAIRDGATLVLVLGDHATGGLSIDEQSSGTELVLHWASAQHSGEPVPVFAYGPPSAAGRFAGLFDNTEIPHRVAAALGVEFPLPAAE
jgi:alkaline phosphatase